MATAGMPGAVPGAKPLPRVIQNGRCPECGNLVVVIELNKRKSAMVPEFNSYCGCLSELKCGWAFFSKYPAADIVRYINECVRNKVASDFSKFQ